VRGAWYNMPALNAKEFIMSEINKAQARRFYEELFNQKKLETIDEVCAPDIIDHFPLPDQAPGAQGVKDMFRMYLSAFPDLRVNVEEMIAERDLVVTRFNGEGTHKGELMGAAPTGKKVKFHGLDMVRFRDGKAAEVWHQGDDLLVLMQLGVQLPTG
jgi:predicted ester cyclase